MPTEDDKAAARLRGVGVIRALCYIEQPEEEDQDATVHAVLTDYFEGEATDITVQILPDGQVQTAEPDEKCTGRVADSTLITCSKEATFKIPKDAEVRVTATYEGVAVSTDLGPTAPRRWLDWS